MSSDALDTKLNEVFAGKVVRKDLLLQVKKGTNVPSFVLNSSWPVTVRATIHEKSKKAWRPFWKPSKKTTCAPMKVTKRRSWSSRRANIRSSIRFTSSTRKKRNGLG